MTTETARVVFRTLSSRTGGRGSVVGTPVPSRSGPRVTASIPTAIAGRGKPARRPPPARAPRLDPPQGVERLAHLGQVLRAVGAVGEVAFEPGPVPGIERAFEVVGDELHRLTAHKILSASAEHALHVPHLGLEHAPQPATGPGAGGPAGCPPRGSSSSQTSAALSPSTSRRTRTWRCISGSPSMHGRMRSASCLASRRSSTSSGHGTGGSAQAPSGPKRLGSTAGPPVMTGDRPALTDAGGLGPVDQDVEQPRAQRRPALEPLDAPDQAEPGVLHDLLGDGPAGDHGLGQAQEGGVVALDDQPERGLVACPQPGDELRILHDRGAYARAGRRARVTSDGRRRPPGGSPTPGRRAA